MFDQLYILPILLFSVIIHEIAHGVMALKLGDPTARAMGRLTLNPVPHIDLIGSIFVPLFSLLVAGRVFIAWAKPVPVNPLNFSHHKRDDILVAVVGPFSNIALAFACTVAVILVGLASAPVAGLRSPMLEEGVGFMLKMFYGGVYLNIVLAVFNLIPVPPLDGSHVVASLLPDRLADQYRNIGFFGIFIVIFLMRVPLFSSMFNGIINGISLPFEYVIRLFL